MFYGRVPPTTRLLPGPVEDSGDGGPVPTQCRSGGHPGGGCSHCCPLTAEPLPVLTRDKLAHLPWSRSPERGRPVAPCPGWYEATVDRVGSLPGKEWTPVDTREHRYRRSPGLRGSPEVLPPRPVAAGGGKGGRKEDVPPDPDHRRSLIRLRSFLSSFVTLPQTRGHSPFCRRAAVVRLLPPGAPAALSSPRLSFNSTDKTSTTRRVAGRRAAGTRHDREAGAGSGPGPVRGVVTLVSPPGAPLHLRNPSRLGLDGGYCQSSRGVHELGATRLRWFPLGRSQFPPTAVRARLGTSYESRSRGGR